MFDSLKKLLARFPFFLDKSSGSNFYKSETIFNNRFSEVYNDLFKVYLSTKINKSLLIWKEQSIPNSYSMHFCVNLDNLESVTILKNDEVIYTETFTKDDEVNNFEYIHEDTSENTIPTDKYVFKVTSYTEFELSKGFPENDTVEDNIYDHDTSLDNFGSFIDLPRKNYVATTNYATTIPTYNDRLTEDDYHYMKRILYYLQHLMDTPLEVLEVWKLYDIPVDEIQLVNRERLLCKMFDETRHSTGWVPRNGEHKDTMCVADDEEVYFFASVNNSTPIQLQDFNFKFQFLDLFGVALDKIYYIIPFINDEMVTDTILSSNHIWTVNTNLIGNSDAKFQFKAFSSMGEVEREIAVNNGVFCEFENDIISDELYVNVRGCNSADWFVNPNGDDSNNGLTNETPFKTIEKAVSMVEGSKNIISLANGNYEINNTITIDHDTKIISCPASNPIIKCGSDVFFHISQNKQLYLQNITLKFLDFESYVDDYTFINNNIHNQFLDVIADVLIIVCGESGQLTFDDTTIDVPFLEKYSSVEFNSTGNGDADFIVKDESDNPTLIFIDEGA